MSPLPTRRCHKSSNTTQQIADEMYRECVKLYSEFEWSDTMSLCRVCRLEIQHTLLNRQAAANLLTIVTNETAGSSKQHDR